MTYRRFGVLLKMLPTEARFKQAVLGDTALWDREDHRLTDLLDAVVMLNHNLVQSKSKKRLKVPKPVKRPGTDDAIAANTRKLTGKPIPMARLKKLTEKWRTGDGGEG